MKTIESTKSVYLDGVKYTRVFYVDLDCFDDIESGYYPVWLEMARDLGDIA